MMVLPYGDKARLDVKRPRWAKIGRPSQSVALRAGDHSTAPSIKEVLMRYGCLFCVALLWVFGSSAAHAESGEPSPYIVADVFVIHSNVLDEDRRIFIYNPDHVGGNVLPAYPVLYLLEENDMPMVAGTVKYLSSYNEQLPAMLVVGIDGGGQRIRDLTPTHSLYDNHGNLDADPDSWLRPSGGAEKFLRFVKEEVMPFVERKYRTAPFKIIAGHSVGGLATIHALTAHPDMFNAYLAVSPSLWWDKGAYLRSAAQHLPTSGPDKEFLFIADSPETGHFSMYMKSFLDALEAKTSPSFQWAHMFYSNETHGSVAAKAYYDGLRFLYPQWNVPEENRSAASIRSHYAALSDRLGYDVQPPFGLVSGWAGSFLRQGMIDDAIETSRINVSNFPTNARAHSDLGDAYLRKGDRAVAIASYAKAVELAPDNESMKAKLAAAVK
ncbi:alpha/beta hydrolase-fold protein [Luteimonas salinilitoris]|uniref:Alpha/beta hydrolase-fold protein n=1 Tax=Luteimonas salinilitoris TaxID=3237697 RepID=A0ABV4HNP1_9GAMM